MFEVAHTFHTQPSELRVMRVGELLRWHEGARYIHKRLQG